MKLSLHILHKLFTIALVTLVGISCTVSLFQWDQGWAQVHTVTSAVIWFLKFIWFCVAAPAFIAYRLITAPSDSTVFPIAYITCALSGFLIYHALFDRMRDVSGLGTVIAIALLWFGAFLCLFPKWKTSH